MTDHKGLPVAGYMPQTDKNVALVNEHKQIEERLLRRIDKLGIELLDREGLRWLMIAHDQLQMGFMALNRAVLQPQRIDLPEDEE